MRRVYAGMIVCLLAGVRPAQAQGADAPRLFVDGTALAAVNLRSHVESRGPVESSNNLSITVPASRCAGRPDVDHLAVDASWRRVDRRVSG